MSKRTPAETKGMAQPTQLSIQWMVSARARILNGLAALYEIHRVYEAKLVEDYEQCSRTSLPNAASYFTGIAFSLWRAAFLFYEVETRSRTAQAVVQKQSRLLLQLTKDNSASYGTEVDTRDWMSGFHMNNAKFRMVRLCELMNESTSELLDESRLASNLAAEWDAMYEKFVHLLSIYQKDLESRMPLKDKMGKKRRNELFYRYFESAKLLKSLQDSLQV